MAPLTSGTSPLTITSTTPWPESPRHPLIQGETVGVGQGWRRGRCKRGWGRGGGGGDVKGGGAGVEGER